MRLIKVISGGQTGADRTALECAKALGIKTGGKAPKNWKTDAGPDPSLADFGMIQSYSSDYAVRTRENVKDSDATVWFGKTSPGYWCTRNACRNLGKPFYEHPTDLQIEYLINTYPILNFAGNRKRINPGIVEIVKDAFQVIAGLMQASLNKSVPNYGPTEDVREGDV